MFTQAAIDELIALEKPVEPADWRVLLTTYRVQGANRAGRLDLMTLDSGPIRGALHLYVRASRVDANDWSVGLVLVDLAGNSYRVVRCNGPHPSVHTNRLHPQTERIVVTPHVHYLREEYLRDPRTDGDGFAVPTDAYVDLNGAIEHLAQQCNLRPVERLFL